MSSYLPPLLPPVPQPIRRRPGVSALLWRRDLAGPNVISRYHYSFDVAFASPSAPVTSGLPVSSGSPLNDFALHPRHLPRLLAHSNRTPARFPLPHTIDTRLLLGQPSAPAFIPRRRRYRSLSPSTTSRVRAPPTPYSLPCIFYLHSTLGFVDPQLVSLHQLRCFRISIASHLPTFPPPPSALPGWPSYAFEAVPVLYKQKI
ncbi:hypothetical protein V8D89_012550 [Ganoderma adspersum]